MTDEHGVLMPTGELVATAERFGLVEELDRWVFNTALASMERRDGPPLFINLSGVSLGNEALVAHFEERMRRSPIRRGLLGFELTETAVVADWEAAKRVMNRLQHLGCRFSLDDFGVGFSSFSYLRTLPVDFVKIDASFIRGLESDPAARAIVRAIASVSRSLGHQAIAEGVEGARTAEVVAELGVAHGQGYHWGRPAPDWPHQGQITAQARADAVT